MIRKPAPGGAEIGRRATSRPLSQRSGGEGDEDEQAADRPPPGADEQAVRTESASTAARAAVAFAGNDGRFT